MIFRQLFEPVSCTYTYLLADEDTREAVILDCVFETHARDAALIRELDLTLVYAIDTHCHADHVTGAWLMKEATGAQIAISKAAGVENADVLLEHGDALRFGKHSLEARSTPGHTDGCLSFVTGDLSKVFTGDALLIRGAGRTDFQQGDARRLYKSIREQILSLPDECVVYPAHDYNGRTSSTVAEERAHNPRIGGKASEVDFATYMENLGLAHPKKIDIAVPANLKSGKPEDGEAPAEPTWGPVVRSYAGMIEIDAEWVARHLDEVHVLDVREAAELEGELGSIEGAQNIPLDQLRDRLDEVPRDKPVVSVCRSGKRSGMATQILLSNGWTEAANVTGGLLDWVEAGLPRSRTSLAPAT